MCEHCGRYVANNEFNGANLCDACYDLALDMSEIQVDIETLA